MHSNAANIVNVCHKMENNIYWALNMSQILLGPLIYVTHYSYETKCHPISILNVKQAQKS